MTFAALRFTVAAVAACFVPALPVAAQAPAPAEPAEVLILGTYHFANPGQDVVKTEVADVQSATKQAEIRSVIQALAPFRPTRIAVEVESSSADLLDSLYHAYRRGEHELSRSETQQLGFRLAAMSEHPRLHPIDHDGEFPYGAVMEYAQEHDSAFVSFVNEEVEQKTEEMNRWQRDETIGEILRLMNEPAQLERDHGIYMRFAEVGAGDTNVGAELLSDWYERNIHIFANLQRITESGDRVLVIIGAGHAPILRELVSYDPGMSLEDPLAYLP